MGAQATELVVRRSVIVERPVEEAFRIFTEGIASWWPLASHSLGGDRAETVVLEGRAGGRLYERTDGKEASWGRIDAWEPPRRIVIAWKVNPRVTEPSEVEVRFSPEGSGTRVELEHRGFESFGAEAGAASASYRDGWKLVLGHYAEAAGGGTVS